MLKRVWGIFLVYVQYSGTGPCAQQGIYFGPKVPTWGLLLRPKYILYTIWVNGPLRLRLVWYLLEPLEDPYRTLYHVSLHLGGLGDFGRSSSGGQTLGTWLRGLRGLGFRV